MADLRFAYRVVKHVKSRHRLCQGPRDRGIGAGQMSRVDSARIAPGRPAKRQGAWVGKAADRGFGRCV